ncbi:MAG TPA: hypothetical protein VGC12_01805 [Methyloradius sp.]
MQKLMTGIQTLAAFVIAVALCMLAYQGASHSRLPVLSTQYHAVALMNGQLFFGRLEGLGDDYTVLRDVFYIQARQKPGSTEIANVLVKRGGEAHAPDRMIINRQQVLLIEPVKEGSQIAKLIAEQNTLN